MKSIGCEQGPRRITMSVRSRRGKFLTKFAHGCAKRCDHGTPTQSTDLTAFGAGHQIENRRPSRSENDG